ncbi:Pectate-lyase-3 domain-containing protein [Fusarium sp. LHS14.1]|nr:Pectate-lyase-3 domain-containing protein [Fusarium sp. LHS14.1]
MLHLLIVTILVVALTVYFVCDSRDKSMVHWRSIETPNGDKFPDFSFSGYRNSEVSLPTVNTAAITLSFPNKSYNDIRPLIQKAIDSVASSGGGVVELPSGSFPISAGIQLRSHVTVRGSKTGETTLILKGQSSKPVFTLGSVGNASKATFGAKAAIIDNYVPIGSSIVNIQSNTGLSVNQTVYISRAATESWIKSNGMGDLVRDGTAQTWITANKNIMSPNVIKAIEGTKLTLQIPLTDALYSKYMSPQVWAYTPPGLYSEMGLQNLRIQVPNTCSGASLSNDTCNFAAVKFPAWTVDSWARGLKLEGFNRFFDVDTDASRITIQEVEMNRNQDIEGRALPIDILLQGSQVLVQDCKQVGLPTARCFSVATDSLAAGPNTVIRHSTMSDVQTIYPHERWAHGLLVEMTSVPTLFVNRASNGTGHGWAINAGVGWNLRGEAIVQSPPLGVNWCIGCGGTNGASGNGTFVRPDKKVKPESLFAAQREARGLH